MNDAPKAFAIEAADDVRVSLDDSSDDETFAIHVSKGDEVLESHTGVTAETVADLSSEHFTATHVEAPVGDDSGDVEYDEDAEGGEESEGVERDEG